MRYSEDTSGSWGDPLPSLIRPVWGTPGLGSPGTPHPSLGGEGRAPRTKFGIGRHRLRYHFSFYGRDAMTERGEALPERWELLYRTAYSGMLGARLRRIREGRHLTQGQALRLVKRPPPSKRTYSQGFLSRIEAGYANSPLYAYIHLAEAYKIDPGRLMGPEEAEKPVGEAGRPRG